MAYLEHIPTRPLYHYTNEAGFRGILQSRELWLSDLQQSNDPRDLHMGLATLRQIMNNIRVRDYSQKTGDTLAKMIMKITRYFETDRLYTTCFTPYADNINMWREYGDGGKGYSIGFRPRAITDMHGRIYQVRYIDDDSHDDLYNLISEILKPIEIYGDGIFHSIERELEIATALISIAGSLKHITWEYEHEVRLTFAAGDNRPSNQMPVSFFPDEREMQWKKFRTRQAGEKMIKYHSLPFGKFVGQENNPREAVFCVLLGPKSNLSEGDVKKILLDNGFSSFNVSSSTCAFR
ncbi:DUF2971 domain-containing protein [Chelativorans sp. ZYF759]|uniref:DUF2971 domain-containing protein n=1 Tax=Chelativorans sp. ZYF759 TaxID=2692213 RepID=UPI00145D3BA7|nr:DUF2971 domain-containing protein [Chelativorans sp. ZYF759]NMG38535.1 DUF2971 domain-containing protein [Chelativorans sp. ZYF759]